MKDNKKDYIGQIFKSRYNKYIFLIIIVGAVFMLGGHKAVPKKKAADTPPQQTATEEQRLAAIISDIKGAGNVSVMITYEGTSEKDLAYETRSDRTTKQEGGVLTENIDKQAVMASGEPTVIKETYPQVKGVVVTAEGAADAAVKNNIREAVQSALGVPSHKICVFEKK